MNATQLNFFSMVTLQGNITTECIEPQLNFLCLSIYNQLIRQSLGFLVELYPKQSPSNLNYLGGVN